MLPIFDITRQNKILKKELDRAISSVIYGGVFILGTKVEGFEKAFAKYIGVKYSVGVASGTDAISLALLALGVGKGDEVIMPANSYPSVFAVAAVGAVPKLVDIDPATFNINPALIADAITRKTRAILPVHLYGGPADMEKILGIGAKYKIPVVEDCAQAVGAQVELETGDASGGPPIRAAANTWSEHEVGVTRGRTRRLWKKVGSIGQAACFSFYPTKNLGCFGDGGMVVTDDREIYEKVKLLRMYGEKTRYNSVVAGRNSRLDELQAAILLAKLKYLDKWNKRRREIAQLYFSLFLCLPKEIGRKERVPQWKFAGFSNLKQSGGPLPHAEQRATPRLLFGKKNYANIPRGSFLPIEAAYTKHIYHLFVIRTKKRDQLKDYLEKRGIQTAIHYPVPIHLVPSIKYLGYKKGDFPISEQACEEILSLPMFPELVDKEIKQVVDVISQFLQNPI